MTQVTAPMNMFIRMPMIPTVFRERVGWSDEVIRTLDAEAAAGSDKESAGLALADLVDRER